MCLQSLKNFHKQWLDDAVSMVKRHNLQLPLNRGSGKRLYGGQLERLNRKCLWKALTCYRLSGHWLYISFTSDHLCEVILMGACWWWLLSFFAVSILYTELPTIWKSGLLSVSIQKLPNWELLTSSSLFSRTKPKVCKTTLTRLGLLSRKKRAQAGLSVLVGCANTEHQPPPQSLGEGTIETGKQTTESEAPCPGPAFPLERSWCLTPSTACLTWRWQSPGWTHKHHYQVQVGSSAERLTWEFKRQLGTHWHLFSLIHK